MDSHTRYCERLIVFMEAWHKIKLLLVLDLSSPRLREHTNSVNSAWTYVCYIINACMKEVVSSTSYRLNCKNGKENLENVIQTI